jgi:hypothetical protein
MSGPVYVASARPEASPSPVLVVACSKGAYLAATREFLERHLGLSEGAYHLLAVPGGPQLLVLSEHQRGDLRHAAEGLRGIGLPLAVEAWFVAPGADGRLEFHPERV